jgi:hypothetical protein
MPNPFALTSAGLELFLLSLGEEGLARAAIGWAVMGKSGAVQ